MKGTFIYLFLVSYDCMSLNGKWCSSGFVFSFVLVMFEYGCEISDVDSSSYDTCGSLKS